MTSDPIPGRHVVGAHHEYIEPWYLAYALVGATVSGGVPILLPLTVGRYGATGHVGLVMAAFYLGSVAATLWGVIADRYWAHRALFTIGAVISGCGIGAFAAAPNIGAQIALALVAGCGAAAASTVAYLFVVEAHPRNEWPPRLAHLQLFSCIGQVAGLAFAGLMSHVDLRAGLLIDGALMIGSAVVALRTAPTPVGRSRARTTPAAWNGPLLPLGPRVERGPASGSHHLRLPTLAAVWALPRVVGSPFAVFLASWILAFSGSTAFFIVYPVAMARIFGIDPARSSLAYAAAVGISLFLFSPAGAWAKRWGPLRMVRLGLGVRFVSLLAIAVCTYTRVPGRGLVAIAAFAALVVAWPALSVGGAATAAERNPFEEGAGMGLYNAATAVASVLGSLTAGWVAALWDYHAVAVAGAICLSAGFLVNLAVRGPQSPETSPGTPAEA